MCVKLQRTRRLPKEDAIKAVPVVSTGDAETTTVPLYRAAP
jgi:hypothetical protein